MNIEKLVEAALQNGHLTSVMEAEVKRLCESISDFSVGEYEAIDRLMGAILTGEVKCSNDQEPDEDHGFSPSRPPRPNSPTPLSIELFEK
jgi:hypothetical protein